MTDWESSGYVFVVSPGYNSNYCLDIYGKSNISTIKNVAYTSDAFMIVGYMKYNTIKTPVKYYVGHTAYGSLLISNGGSVDWFKFRFVAYFNSNIGAVMTMEKWDENNNTWTPINTVTVTNITEPNAGNVMFKTEAKIYDPNVGYLYGEGHLYLDNLELYTGKSLYISKIVSEAIENVIGTS